VLPLALAFFHCSTGLGYMAGYVPESTTMYKVRPGGTVCVCALEWHLTA
jgi:hypothetical protein